jgi:UDP-glucose:(heptosyl)LPS alpha-1,3-glucosyltransferase
MNIAFLHRRYDRTGGTERDLYELVGRMLQFGHEVHLYCGEYRIPVQEGAIVHRVPYLKTGETAKLLSFASLAPQSALAGNHDLLVSFGKVFRQDIARCGGGTHRRYLEAMNRIRTPLKNMLKWPKDRAALYVEERQFRRENCRRVIAVSNIVKDELVQVYQVPEHAIDVIYDGIDTELFSPENREVYCSSIRRDYRIGDNDFLILFVGSGFLRKGLDFLLQAVAESKMTDMKLLIVGHDSNVSRFKQTAQRLGISDAVTFAGPQKDVHRFYAAADMLLLPSVQEAFGNVVLEALACGLPVITTKNAGASEILQGKLRDFILDRPDDIMNMARMVRELTHQDIRNELSPLARNVAEQHSFEANARAIEEICEKCLKYKLTAKAK